jgi:hypothetical protein
VIRRYGGWIVLGDERDEAAHTQPRTARGRAAEGEQSVKWKSVRAKQGERRAVCMRRVREKSNGSAGPTAPADVGLRILACRAGCARA